MNSLPKAPTAAAPFPSPGNARSAAMSAEWINPLENSEWDAWVQRLPDYCFFHGTAWARVLNDCYRFESRCWIPPGGRNPAAGILVTEIDSFLTGRRGVSVPFADLCPPLAVAPALWQEVFPQLVQHGRNRGWRTYECRGGRSPEPGALPAVSYYQHSLDLDRREGAVFRGFDGSVRRAIRKAEREGVQVEIGSTEAALRTFYQLHCGTRKRHGLPPQPLGFFNGIHRHILARDMGFVVNAHHGQRPVAGAVFFHLGRKAVYKYGASDGALLHLRGNNLVMWEGIKCLVRRGVDTLHFGRTSLTNAGLRAFKRGWGTLESRLDYYKYNLRKEAYVLEQDPTRGWHTAVFQLLPAAVGRLAGTLLHRHLA